MSSSIPLPDKIDVLAVGAGNAAMCAALAARATGAGVAILERAPFAEAHNRYLLQTLGQLENATALLRGTTYAVAGRAQTAAAEHRALVEAIARRDQEAAEAAARLHIANAQRARLRLLLEEEQ